MASPKTNGSGPSSLLQKADEALTRCELRLPGSVSEENLREARVAVRGATPRLERRIAKQLEDRLEGIKEALADQREDAVELVMKLGNAIPASSLPHARRDHLEAAEATEEEGERYEREVAEAEELVDWRCECGDLNRGHEAFCFRCGAGKPEDRETVEAFIVLAHQKNPERLRAALDGES